jgi:hypothetical protein
MKKLLVKIKVIDIPYSAEVPAIPATETEAEIPAIPEQLEVSHEEIIAQTQGNDEELVQWLAGNLHKYPADFTTEYIDISAEVEFNHAVEAAQAEIAKGIKALAVFKVRVKAKGLTSVELASLFSNPKINTILATLSTGSIGLAIALINAFPVDGHLVTEEDKAAVIAALG